MAELGKCLCMENLAEQNSPLSDTPHWQLKWASKCIESMALDEEASWKGSCTPLRMLWRVRFTIRVCNHGHENKFVANQNWDVSYLSRPHLGSVVDMPLYLNDDHDEWWQGWMMTMMNDDNDKWWQW